MGARQRVVVDDAVDRLVLVLEPDVVADRAQVVAEVDDARTAGSRRRCAAAATGAAIGAGAGPRSVVMAASVADAAHPGRSLRHRSATIRPMSPPEPVPAMSGARCASPSSARGPSGGRWSSASARAPDASRRRWRALELVGRRRARRRARRATPASRRAPDRRAGAPRRRRDVDVIVELMGGDEPARTLIAAALSMGKPSSPPTSTSSPTTGRSSRRSPADRRRAPLRGGGRRRDPGPRPARRRPRRRTGSARARHRQRHDELHPHGDDRRGGRSTTPTSSPRRRGWATRRPTRRPTSRATTRSTSW